MLGQMYTSRGTSHFLNWTSNFQQEFSSGQVAGKQKITVFSLTGRLTTHSSKQNITLIKASRLTYSFLNN